MDVDVIAIRSAFKTDADGNMNWFQNEAPDGPAPPNSERDPIVEGDEQDIENQEYVRGHDEQR